MEDSPNKQNSEVSTTFLEVLTGKQATYQKNKIHLKFAWDLSYQTNRNTKKTNGTIKPKE